MLRDLSACFECQSAGDDAPPRAMRMLVSEQDRHPSEALTVPAGPQTANDLFALGRFWP
ncbi:MAG: hypothetical protein JHD35_07550 [Sphingopyxis sp.]|nr:hypothetical protein [Sphingopyxis sp.]